MQNVRIILPKSKICKHNSDTWLAKKKSTEHKTSQSGHGTAESLFTV